MLPPSEKVLQRSFLHLYSIIVMTHLTFDDDYTYTFRLAARIQLFLQVYEILSPFIQVSASFPSNHLGIVEIGKVIRLVCLHRPRSMNTMEEA